MSEERVELMPEAAVLVMNRPGSAPVSVDPYLTIQELDGKSFVDISLWIAKKLGTDNCPPMNQVYAFWDQLKAIHEVCEDDRKKKAKSIVCSPLPIQGYRMTFGNGQSVEKMSGLKTSPTPEPTSIGPNSTGTTHSQSTSENSPSPETSNKPNEQDSEQDSHAPQPG